MESMTDDSTTIITRVTEAHELVDKIKKEIFGEEERRITRRIVHKMLFYFLVILMAGVALGFFYQTWTTEKRLSMAKKTGILTLGDGSMFELVPVAPKNQGVVK
jgi:hypothetical protein